MAGTDIAAIRRRIYERLEPEGRTAPGLSWENKLIVALVLLAVMIAILDSEETVAAQWGPWLVGTELVVTGVFVIEYVARLWVAGENPRYRGVGGRLRYLVTPAALVDLLAIAPVLLGMFGGESLVLRLVRLLRILRIARLGRFSRAATAIAEALVARRYELVMSVVISGILLLITSTLLYIVEGGVQPEYFGSIPRAMWWSIATLTTVGYGDVVPVSGLGRLLAGGTALLGIGLIALPTGILASAFSDAIQRQRAAEKKEQEEKSASQAKRES
jgi:voltage-gated potassium channel